MRVNRDTKLLAPFVALYFAVGLSSTGLCTEQRVFSKDSFWYQEIPEKVTLHPNSQAFASDFMRQLNTYYGHVAINSTKYSSPVYIVDKDVPAQRVKQWDCQKKGYLDRSLAEQWSAVPIPKGAVPAEGSDAEMTVYQASTDTLWEFWQARMVNGKWEACWGGRIANASSNIGVFNTYYGTTATSLPFIGGQITPEELARGEINHVIGIALVDLEAHYIYSWPAHRSDGYNPKKEPNRIPQGLRFRIDPAIDIDKLNLHPVAKTIAKAGQKYGFIVWDKAGAISLRANNPLAYTSQGGSDPYPAIWKGTPGWSILKGIPWDKLQFLPMDYGKP